VTYGWSRRSGLGRVADKKQKAKGEGRAPEDSPFEQVLQVLQVLQVHGTLCISNLWHLSNPSNL
jgi:hypothetical protein